MSGATVADSRLRTVRNNPHRIGVFIYPGMLAMDAIGPADIFGLANYLREREGEEPADYYDVCLVGIDLKPVRTATGINVVADATLKKTDPVFDTLIVPGGYRRSDAEAILATPGVSDWLLASAGASRRVASVCTGALMLAELGLLKGKKATTHWAFCDQLSAAHPDTNVEPDSLWVRDGKIYTSAGITTGMDLALALVEEDLGRRFALELARLFVMFLKRPGGQSQFSSELIAQITAPDRLEDLIDWIRDNLEKPLSIDALAQRSGMSARNFQRVFTRQCGLPPAKFIERLRVERARVIIEDTHLSMAEIAGKSGFETEQRMRRSFQRILGINPTAHADRVRNPAARSVTDSPV